jgi:hydrogenase maturation protease
MAMKNNDSTPRILVLGIGCTLLRDEGFGVQVVHDLDKSYHFPDHVSLMDGGVLGVNLLGYIANCDRLIVVDAIRNGGQPGDLYRLTGDQVPQRIRAKNSVHQVDFLEALTLCQALENVPRTVIVGVEPEDITTCSIELTPTLEARKADVIAMVLKELDAMDVNYEIKEAS